MSLVQVTVEVIDSLHAHPNADRLEIAKIRGAQTIVPVGNFQVGDKVLFFPPDILLPPEVSEQFGVINYLKHSDWNGDKIQCRVGACRLRGIPSYGFIAHHETAQNSEPGTDVSEAFGAKKYTPRVNTLDGAPPISAFHRYTDIQHFWRNTHIFRENDQVVVTEKLHGRNCRIGLIRQFDGTDNHDMLMYGSHNCRLRLPNAETTNIYAACINDKIDRLMKYLQIYGQDVIVFGELVGPRCQDLDYGFKKPTFVVFDITVNGSYMNHLDVVVAVSQFEIEYVPILYEGPFNENLIEKYTDGPSMLPGNQKFKGREGIVVKPLRETDFIRDISRAQVRGRPVLKSVSVDYLSRKGAKDDGE